MQALSGTLKTARRLGVVGFEGEHLMQGRDNHVLITLLDDSDKQYQIVVSDKGTSLCFDGQALSIKPLLPRRLLCFVKSQ